MPVELHMRFVERDVVIIKPEVMSSVRNREGLNLSTEHAFAISCFNSVIVALAARAVLDGFRLLRYQAPHCWPLLRK